MAVAFGKINPFRANQDDWTLYVEQPGHVMVANGIMEDYKKRAMLLSVIGENTSCSLDFWLQRIQVINLSTR